MFSHTDDYVSLTEQVKYPIIHEIELNDKHTMKSLIEITNNDKDIIPLFIKDADGELEIISSYS